MQSAAAASLLWEESRFLNLSTTMNPAARVGPEGAAPLSRNQLLINHLREGAFEAGLARRLRHSSVSLPLSPNMCAVSR